MVLASRPVASDMRFAARPVGAHRATRAPRASRMRMMAFTSVVLPVPGPPVMTSSLSRAAFSTASFWTGERVMPAFASKTRDSSSGPCVAARPVAVRLQQSPQGSAPHPASAETSRGRPRRIPPAGPPQRAAPRRARDSTASAIAAASNGEGLRAFLQRRAPATPSHRLPPRAAPGRTGRPPRFSAASPGGRRELSRWHLPFETRLPGISAASRQGLRLTISWAPLPYCLKIRVARPVETPQDCRRKTISRMFRLPAPCIHETLRPLRADALDLAQLLRLLFDDFQRPRAEPGHQPRGQLFSDPLDEARAEEALDAGGGHRRHSGKGLHLELRAELRVPRPAARQAQALPRLDAGKVAHGGDLASRVRQETARRRSSRPRRSRSGPVPGSLRWSRDPHGIEEIRLRVHGRALDFRSDATDRGRQSQANRLHRRPWQTAGHGGCE